MKFKAALGLAALLLSATYILFCGRSYVAQSNESSASARQLRHAIRIAPDNSSLHYALGRQLWLQYHNLNAAITEYNVATRLNPYPADYWIELATAYSVAGNDAGRDAAIERAERAAPYDTTVLWDVANLNLMRGDTMDGLHEMRTVIQYGASNVDRYIELCWKVTGSVDTVMAEALPPSPGAYETLLRLTTYLNRADDAEKVWRRAKLLNLQIAPRVALPYFDFLLTHQRSGDAATQWREYAAISPSFRAYAPTADNLVVNPNFALPVLNAGLDWRYGFEHDVSVTIDPAVRNGSGSAIAVEFDGSPADAGIYQLVPVTSGTTYSLSATVRSEIEGVDGPRLAVLDASTQKRLSLSDPVSGSTDWHTIGGSFRTPDSTSLIAIRVVRFPSTSQIRGRVWLTKFSLRTGS